MTDAREFGLFGFGFGFFGSGLRLSVLMPTPSNERAPAGTSSANGDTRTGIVDGGRGTYRGELPKDC
jgi:hypothetical protein